MGHNRFTAARHSHINVVRTLVIETNELD